MKEAPRISVAAPPPRRKANYGLSEKIGSTLGGLFGPAGRELGGLAGRAFSHITGMGEYHIRSNSLMNEKTYDSQGPPVFATEASHRIRHREFVQDITSTVNFAVTKLAVNPGQTSTFPWLSRLAANYEQFRIHGVVFEFKSTSATAIGSTNTALGSVIMVTDHDALDPSFTTKRQMEAYEFSVAGSPADNILHPVECNPHRNVMEDQFVRSGAIPAGGDLRFYDLGNFYIATVGMQAVSVIGELWVSYDVELIRPKIPTPLGEHLLGCHYKATPVTGGDWFADDVRVPGGNLTLTFDHDINGVFQISRAGRYQVAIVLTADVSMASSYTIAPDSQAVLVSNKLGDPARPFTEIIGALGGPPLWAQSTWFMIDVLEDNASIALGANLVFGGNGSLDILVQQMSSGLNEEPLRALDPRQLDAFFEKKYREMQERSVEKKSEDRAAEQIWETIDARRAQALLRAEEELKLQAPVQNGPAWHFFPSGVMFDPVLSNVALERSLDRETLDALARRPNLPISLTQAIVAILRNKHPDGVIGRGVYSGGEQVTNVPPSVQLTQSLN